MIKLNFSNSNNVDSKTLFPHLSFLQTVDNFIQFKQKVPDMSATLLPPLKLFAEQEAADALSEHDAYRTGSLFSLIEHTLLGKVAVLSLKLQRPTCSKS